MKRLLGKTDERDLMRSEKAAKVIMWNHYRDNKNLYYDGIRTYRDSIIYELMRVECVEMVFQKYRVKEKVVA